MTNKDNPYALNFEFTEKQADGFNTIATEVLFGGALGGGKIVSYDAEILTPFGFVRGDKIKKGMLINNPDGTVQRIIQISPEMELPAWTVHFSDGTSTKVAEGHLWLAWRASKGIKIGNKRTFGEASAKVVETKTLKDWLDRGYKPQIPVCKEQPFNITTKEREMLDPYLLGLLLGDEHLGTVTLTACKEDALFYAGCLAEQAEIDAEDVHFDGDKTLSFVGETKKVIKEKLKLYKLQDKLSHDKFIPKHFKMGSVQTRYGVLQGLFDTDAHSSVDKNQIEYVSVSKQLAEDVAFIVRSLGGTASITTKTGSYRNEAGERVFCRKVYRVWIRHPNPDKLFRLKRKQHGSFGMNLVQKRVVKVEIKGTVKGRCITVDNPNGLYITDDFIVTHNSYLMRISAIIWCSEIPNLQVYLFRRLSPDLIKNHMEGPKGFRVLLKPWSDAGFVKIVKEEIRFWNGSKIYLCHCQEEKDRFKYLGAEIHVLLIDELTQFTEVIYRFLRTRVRMVGIDLPKKYEGRFPRILCASNPGNIGHGWVKRTFVDKCAPYKVYDMPDTEGGFRRQYIPSKLSDNPYLMKESPNYIKTIRGLGNAALVKAYEEGDWNIVVGAYFAEFSLMRHVIKPFTIPQNWQKVRSLDWGWSKPFCVQWWAISDGSIKGIPDGAFVCYREWYGASAPNEGLRLDAEQVAKGILEKESAGEVFSYSVADPSIVKRESGPSIRDQFRKYGVYWKKADNNRQAGWLELNHRLRGNPDGEPMIFWFETCVNSIRTLPALQHDDKNPDDVNTKQEDHCFTGDTLIRTQEGDKMLIELLGRKNVKVLTSCGEWCNCKNIKLYFESADIVDVVFSDGSFVSCTPDHKFMTAPGVFVEAEKLKGALCLKNPNSNILLKYLIPFSFSVVKNITYAVNTFSEKVKGFTEWFTKLTTGKSQKDSACIILTETELITPLSIWRLSHTLNTSISTLKTKEGSKRLGRQSRLRAKPPKSGTPRRKEKLGTNNTTKKSKENYTLEQKNNASIAERRSSEHTYNLSAQADVNLLIDAHRALITREDLAVYADKVLLLINMLSPLPVLRNVVRRYAFKECTEVRKNGKAPVYCLTVPEKYHFTLANGLIVSNCADTTRYALMTRRLKKFSMNFKPHGQKPLHKMTFNDLLKLHGMSLKPKKPQRL